MIVKYTTKELDLLARLMRAEALGEGNLGMLMVGNVGVNRVIADCLDFTSVRSIYDMVYQSPGGFSGIKSALFQSSSTTSEKNLAKRIIKGEYFHPATGQLSGPHYNNKSYFMSDNISNIVGSTWVEKIVPEVIDIVDLFEYSGLDFS